MVLEFRKDPTKDATLILASKRAKRPDRHAQPKIACPFCKGRENTTPPATLELPSKAHWRIRAFENAFPFLKHESAYVAKDMPFWHAPAFGYHEILVEHDKHAMLLQHFDAAHTKSLAQAYSQRLEKIENMKGIEYAYAFKNHGKRAGASIDHEHSQMAGLPFIPPIVQHELAHYGRNPKYYEKLAANESLILAKNDVAVAVCVPFPRFAFETWIIPKEKVSRMSELSLEERVKFFDMIKLVVGKIYSHTEDYNIAFHSAPKGEEFHFHAEIYPRMGAYAGLELGAGVIVNDHDEKTALKELRG